MMYNIKNLIKEAKFDFAKYMPLSIFNDKHAVVVTHEIPDTLFIRNIIPTNQIYLEMDKIR